MQAAHEFAAEHPEMIAVTCQGLSTEVGCQQMLQEWRERFQLVATEVDVAIVKSPAMRPLGEIGAEFGQHVVVVLV